MRLVSILAGVVSAVVSTTLPGVAHAEKTYAGPASVPVFHPLCLQPLREHKADGGAFDMAACAKKHQNIVVKNTPDGGYFASRPAGAAGQSGGYVVYRPIGTLDNALELLLVHNKADKPYAESSVYVVGRLPELGPQMRDFLTTIEEKGDRCNGGVQSARLVSEALLEVDLNVSPAALMRITQPKTPGFKTFTGTVSTLSLKPKGKLDDRPTTCIGTLTKTYDLLENKEGMAWVSFLQNANRVADEPYQQCFDDLVADYVKPPATLSMKEFQLFVELFNAECKVD